ncbi:Sugar phosphate transporter domain - like 3 [Theobroma cacao]|nr:Sugar phosphate transporter domain - like 3 [Theobroma cacao]
MQRMRQILGPLFSRDVMKQNHSDDAKPGRALESNQSLLFDNLHSSESSERQQQRICGPLAALTFNLVVAVGIIFMNKWVLKNVGFQFPVFLTVIHYAVSWALMAILNFFSLFSASPSSKVAPLSLFTFGVVNSVSTGLANVSLKYNSVGFYQMAKIAITPLIVLLEFIWYRKRIAFSKVIALTVVSIGVAVATVTDLQFSLFGACVALAWILPSAVNKILWSNVQQRENWTALAYVNVEDNTNHFVFFGFYDSFLGSSWCPCIPLELQQYISNSHVCFSWLLASVVECFDTWTHELLTESQQLLMKIQPRATSAISSAVLGQFKTCVVLLGNYYLFGSNPGISSIFGAFIAIGGMSLYTYLNIRPMKRKSSKVLP